MASIYEKLDKIERPSRYLGGEKGSIIKNEKDVRLKIALAFPDVYEIGMSHVGLKILYGLINERPEYWAERIMSPWPDFEDGLRSEKIPPASLDSGRPLGDFDVVGFSLQYELTYTNILNMLDMADIPLWADERGPDHPLVMGGGPNAFNPEPIADFFDFFYLGDAEAGLMDVLDEIASWKKDGTSREEILKRLIGKPGVYVPSFFKPVYDDQGRITEIKRIVKGYDRVERAVCPDLDQAYFPDCPIVPFTKLIHDRVAVEIARGCTRGCRFCQAGFIYRPVRERRPDKILDLADRSLKASGMDEASFLSLSAGDYSKLAGIMTTFMDVHVRDHVALSLPSLRVKSLTPEMMQQIKRVRKTGFTLAPEAGTQRLRDVINKDLTEDDLMFAAREAFRLGWRLIKLYFMVGLPTETEEDVQAIADLAQRVRNGTRGKVNVSFAVFVPKPHTPFQWEPMLTMEEMREKMNLLRNALKKPGLNPKWNEIDSSFIEGVLSRGDRRLAPVIKKVRDRGGRFDSWSEQLGFDRWLEAMAEEGLTPEEYLRARTRDEILPWSHLDSGATEEYLWSEREKAYQGQTTADCRDGLCSGCGVCDFKELKPRLSTEDLDPRPEAQEDVDESDFKRVRVNYSKTGRAALLSHLETVDVFKRAFRRAGLRFRMSQGFHPQPRLHFASPLSVGLVSQDEYLLAEIVQAPDQDEIESRLKKEMPPGFQILRCLTMPENVKKLKIRGAGFRIEALENVFSKEPENLAGDEAILITKKSKKGFRQIDLRSLLGELKVLTPKQVEITLYAGDEGTVRPAAAIEALWGAERLRDVELTVIKTKTLLTEG